MKRIEHDGNIIAIIIGNGFSEPGISFCTPPDYSQQLAYMRHPSGKVIPPHTHNAVHRDVFLTQEVLVLKRGRLRVDFYDEARNYLESCVIGAGDVILLASGGHGFEVLEEVEMIEVKQGPYLGEQDKTRFPAIGSDALRVRK